jgi:O-acetylhomoserine (thiol)-lyase
VDVLDIPALARIAEERRVPLLVDATVTTPALGRAFEMGAHLVMHSATKFLSGHGIVIGGVLVDGGRFDWAADERFPTLSQPYEGFHGMVFAEESPTSAFLLRARREGLRDFGACMAPMTAFHILQGLETLPLRMARHVENTTRIVRFLAGHAAVGRVHHPDVESHPDHALARRLYPRGASAILSFELAGGREAGQRFIEALTLFSHLANIGDAKSLVIHPATTTHFRMDDAALAAAGITPGTVRLSIGLEHPEDLVEDLARALRAAAR